MSQDENATSSGSSCWTDVPGSRRRWKISALPSLKKMPAAFPLISRLPYQSTDCADSHVWRTYLKSVAENLVIERRSSALWIEMFGSIALHDDTVKAFSSSPDWSWFEVFQQRCEPQQYRRSCRNNLFSGSLLESPTFWSRGVGSECSHKITIENVQMREAAQKKIVTKTMTMTKTFYQRDERTMLFRTTIWTFIVTL